MASNFLRFRLGLSEIRQHFGQSRFEVLDEAVQAEEAEYRLIGGCARFAVAAHDARHGLWRDSELSPEFSLGEQMQPEQPADRVADSLRIHARRHLSRSSRQTGVECE